MLNEGHQYDNNQMKQISNRILLYLLFSFLAIAGCNTNSPQVIIPAAPVNLHASVASNSQIDLVWTDNATNESGYKLQRKTTGGIFTDIATTMADANTYSDRNVVANTTYTYRVCAYNSAGNSAQYSNEDSATIIIVNLLLPEVTTTAITAIDTMHATSGGNVTNDGGAMVTARGICWSGTPNPTIDLPTKTTDGTGTGSFASAMSGLLPNTTYHVRAYATNSVGTAYGNDVSFVTQPTPVVMCGVNIAGMNWSCKNLDVAYYRNGDPIPQITDPAQWMNATTGAWCWYNNDSANYGSKYGRIYNYYAVSDPRGLAPAGWHVATESEWSRLMKFLDPAADTVCDYCTTSLTAGGPMKTIGLFNWISPNTGATNSSGFSALPGGFRNHLGNYSVAGHMAIWWSANEFDTWSAYYRYVYYADTKASRYYIDKHYGHYVRVVKD